MNERISRLRKESFETKPSISIERALLTTAFYKENHGKYSIPVMRALNFKNMCEKKTIWIGRDELIVAERGPKPRAVSTFPELNCHTPEDLRILNSREMTSFNVTAEDIDIYENEVVPFWSGRTVRDIAFSQIPDKWKKLYEAGCFTEFMEQRAPGHTSLDDTVYKYGMLDMKRKISEERDNLDWLNDPHVVLRNEELKAMEISCDAAIIFARRHADGAH
jgi:formate C-acetyltransferase